MTVLTQVLYPTQLAAALINCTGTVQDVQAVDSLWVEPLSHTSNTEIRVAFATPKGVLVGEQVLRVQVVKSQVSTGNPTATLNLYQNGVFIHGVPAVAVTLDAEPGANLVFRFDASTLPDLTGANFVARIVGTANAGKGQDQSAVRVGRFQWTVTAEVPVIEKTGSVALSTKASLTAEAVVDGPLQVFFPSAVTNILALEDDPDIVSKMQDMWNTPDGQGARNAVSGSWDARFDFDIPSPMEQPRYLHWVLVLTSSRGPDDPDLVGADRNSAGSHDMKIYYDGVRVAQYTSGAGSYFASIDSATVFPPGTVYDPTLIHIVMSAKSSIKGPLGSNYNMGVMLDALNWSNDLTLPTSVEVLGQAVLQSSASLSITGESTRIANPVTAEAHLSGTSTLGTEATSQLLGTASFIATGITSVVGNVIHPEIASVNLTSTSQSTVLSQVTKIAIITVSSNSNVSADSIVTKLTRAILVGTSEITVTQTSGSLSKVAVSSTSTLEVTGRSIKASQTALGAECKVDITGTVGSTLRTSVDLKATSGVSVTAYKVMTARTNLVAKSFTDVVSTRSRGAESNVQATSEVNSVGTRVLSAEATLDSSATVTAAYKRVLSATVDINSEFTQSVSALKQRTAKVSAQAKASVTVLGNAVNNFKVTMSAKSSVDVSGGISMIGKSNVVSMSDFRARGIKQVVSDVSVASQATLTIEGLRQPTASVSTIVSVVSSASSKRIRADKSHTVARSLVTVTGFKTAGFTVEVVSKATVSVTGARNLRSHVSLVSNATLIASLTDEKQLVSDESFLVGHIRMIETLIGIIPPEALLDAYLMDTSEIFLQGDVNIYEVLDAIRDYYIPLEGVAQ